MMYNGVLNQYIPYFISHVLKNGGRYSEMPYVFKWWQNLEWWKATATRGHGMDKTRVHVSPE